VGTKKQKQSKNKSESVSLAVHDWGDIKLTDKQRLFVHYYTWPGQAGFHCVAKAAKNAGYTNSTATSVVYKMLRSPKIQKLIQKFEAESKASVHDAAQRFIQEKIIRADYSVKDFYDITDGFSEKTGSPWRVFLPKNPDELTAEQLLCVENIQTGKGASNIVFADRQKERDSIIALDKVWNGSGSESGQDLEELREVIIERVILRQEKRTMTNAEIVDKPIDETCEEL
jgi:hypothetical protein